MIISNDIATALKDLLGQGQVQRSYAALWDYADEIRTGRMSLREANDRCRQKRDSLARRAWLDGWATTCRDESGHTREYWGPGEPCGLSCPVYYLTLWF